MIPLPLRIAALIFFSAAAIVLAAIHIYGGGGWNGTINTVLPEMFGFFLEGAILVFLIGNIQQRQATHQKHQLRNHMLSIFSRVDHPIICWRRGTSLKSEGWELITKSNLLGDRTVYMDEITTLRNVLEELVQVAATLSSEHLSAWTRMIYHLGQYAEIPATGRVNDEAQEHDTKFYDHVAGFIHARVD